MAAIRVSKPKWPIRAAEREGFEPPRLAPCGFQEVWARVWSVDRERETACSWAQSDGNSDGNSLMGGRVGRPRGMTTEERFWEKVDKTPTCWLWIGGRVGDADRERGRYGRFATSTTRGSVVLVLPHRYSWELHFGPVPDGLMVLHACDTPACVHPDTSWWGPRRPTRLTHSARAVVQPRQPRDEEPPRDR
jgi:hypothetical protein